MTAPDHLSCTILQLDFDSAGVVDQAGSDAKIAVLNRMASRFNLSTPAPDGSSGSMPAWYDIWRASSTWSGKKFRNSTIEWFSANVDVGDIVEIPYAGDPWDWRLVTLKAMSLDDFCGRDKTKPDPLRIGGPVLTPELLYFHVVNEALRRTYTERTAPGSRTHLDINPGELRFEAGDVLYVPYPVRRKGALVNAAPTKATTPSATVALAPPWVIQFHGFLKEVEAKAAELAAVNKTCLACREQGQQAWSHLMVLHELVRFQLGTADHPSSSLTKLEQLLDGLSNQAMTTLFVNVAAVAEPAANKKRLALADELVKLLSMERPPQRAGELSRVELEMKLPTQRAQRINNDEDLMDMKVRVFVSAYAALAASPRAEVAHRDADKVMHELGLAADSVAAAPLDGSAAVGAVTSIVSTSVGNLPGPSTLAVLFVWLRASIKITEVARAANDPMKSVAFPAGIAEEFQRVGGFRGEEVQRIAMAAESSDPAVTEFADALATRLRGKMSDVSDAIAGNFMVSPGWNVAMTLVNMIALVNVCQSDDKNVPRKAMNVVGGSYLTALGGLRMLASLGPGAPFKKVFDSVGNSFGIVGVVASVLSGYMTAVATNSTTYERVGGGLQAAGGLASLVGFSFGSGPLGFVLLGVGGVFMLASVVASNVDNISHELDQLKRHIGPGAKVVLHEQLGRFLRFPIVQQAGASLTSQVDEALKQLGSSDDSGLRDLERTDANVSALRALRFAYDDIDLMTYVRYPMVSPTVGF